MASIMNMLGGLLWLASIAVLVWGLAKRNKRLVLYSVGVFAIAAGTSALFPSNPGGTRGAVAARSKWSVQDIQAACFTKAQEQLVSPSSARYGRNALDTKPTWWPEDRSWSWVLTTESQNAFGVWLEARWQCHVRDDELILVTPF